MLVVDDSCSKFGGAKKKSKRSQLEAKTTRKPNAWVLHVKAYAKKNGVSYFDALIPAKASHKGRSTLG